MFKEDYAKDWSIYRLNHMRRVPTTTSYPPKKNMTLKWATLMKKNQNQVTMNQVRTLTTL